MAAYEALVMAGAIAIVMAVGGIVGTLLGYALDAYDAWRRRR